MTDLVQGDRVEVTVGAPAHGGHCVARIGGPHGRVVFVRHALPGERVTAEITELHKGFLRADAVEIHEPSPDRVEPPCPFAHPGACGGCDLQHASGEAQLRWKTAIVKEQLRRLAGLEVEVRVEALAPAPARTVLHQRAGRPVAPERALPAMRSVTVTPPDPDFSEMSGKGSGGPGEARGAGASGEARGDGASAEVRGEGPSGEARGDGASAEVRGAGASGEAPGARASGEARGDGASGEARDAGASGAEGLDEARAAQGRRAGDRPEVESRLLGWRSRVRYAVDAAGRPGLLQHRSNQVVPIDRCLIAHPAIQGLDLLEREWADEAALEAVAASGGDVAVLARLAGGGPLPVDDPGEAPALGGGRRVRLHGPAEVVEIVDGQEFRVRPEGFWQVHPAAAGTLVRAVVGMLEPAPGEVSWDLYGGAGLFAAALAERTGARTTLVEASSIGVAAARENLAGLDVDVVQARVEPALRRLTEPVDLVVLDPPRAGAGSKVVKGIAAARPRAVAYVACDPAALARDIATFRGLGWELSDLRAFDCFPMTQHVECVALLVRN